MAKKAVGKSFRASVEKKSDMKGIRNAYLTDHLKKIYITDEEYQQQALENSKSNFNRDDFLKEIKEQMIQTGKQVKLEVVLLSYLFNEDDGKLSFGEKRSIQKHFMKYKKRISSTDYEEIRTLEIENSIGFISNYIFKENIKKKRVEEALGALRTVTNNNERYKSIINDMEKVLLIQDYFE